MITFGTGCNVPEASAFGVGRDNALGRAVDALETVLMSYLADRQ